MLELIQKTLGRILYKLPSLPAQAQIEVTNLCNLDCEMCPREKLNIKYKHMPWERAIAIIDRLRGVGLITLTGWGEPFLHPRIFDMIRYAKDKGFKVQITTNGLFKNDSIVSSIIESGLDSISFSIDSPTNGLEMGHKNVPALKRVKQILESRSGKRPCVTFQATLHQGGEDQVAGVIRFCHEVGGDRVNLGRLDTRLTPQVNRPGPKEEKRIMENADRLGRRLGVQVDCIQYAVSTGAERSIYRLIKGTLHQMGKYCLKTYDYVYINNEGHVTPCCILPNHSVGNILSEELASIWASSRFKDFRENQKTICGKCDLWKISHSL